jgi:hypothetical protein
MSQGIEFKLNGVGRDKDGNLATRDRVYGYHRKPLPLDINKGKKSDVGGLKPIDKRNTKQVLGDDFKSRFTIGFEIEKNELHRDAIKEYELLSGFEKDGSCGYEAVSHILPLVGASQWRTKVFDMMHKCERIIDDRFSRSDRKDYDGNYKCGGHTTLSCEGVSGQDLNDMLRKYSGIVLALFRKRLKNNFCNHNISMKPQSGGAPYVNSIHYKYNVALVKGDLVEFRIVSKFESVKQMMRRYELFYAMMDFAINDGGSFKKFLTKIRPIILSMYGGDEIKVDYIYGLAIDFQKLILTHRRSEKITPFLP